MKNLKIGVFGAHRGMTMITVLAHYEGVDLVAICDKDEKALKSCEKIAQETDSKITYYTDFEGFFQHEMDAVVLANYATEHAPYAIRLLKSGRHVVSEVLPTQNLAEAVALVEAVEESGKEYVFAENYCYFPSTTEMRRLYKAGDLGEMVHGEGEYVHDCEPIWPAITYGERDHWRNNCFSTFYCTHSTGPIIHVTGLRPKKIVGMETLPPQRMLDLGCKRAEGAVMLMQMENGATVKCLPWCNFKREPGSVWYSIYCQNGMMESDRWEEGINKINVYRHNDPISQHQMCYTPQPVSKSRLAAMTAGHGGSDFYTMHYFIQKLLGNSEGDECIGVYEALDMSVPGLLAYESIVNGSIPFDMPDFRSKADRDKYRNHTFCTDPKVAGDMLAPSCITPIPEISDEVYKRVREMWEKDR